MCKMKHSTPSILKKNYEILQNINIPTTSLNDFETNKNKSNITTTKQIHNVNVLIC